ncbi:MAG: hypothetical protein NTX97_09230, partial [Bacteroidetes bacterium]|nr:hypothetical protein [Bacteroidota bacterium]
IKVRGVTSPDLNIDLLDHICCLIEYNLDDYRNFETVYQETLLLFGKKGLKEIQDETNRLLTFKNYYIMNSTMKISGYISSLMILFGSFFKFNHWPGASVLLVMGVFFIAFLFLPLLFVLKFKSTPKGNRSVVLSSVAFVAATLLCSGLLFKNMHWPGAQMLIVISGVLLVFGYLPVYFLSVYKNTTDKISATATVILIIAGSGLIISIGGMNGIPRPTSDSFWRGVTENNDLLNFIEQENSNRYLLLDKGSKSDSSKSDKIQELKTATEDLMNYTKKMKVYLISKVENISEAEAAKQNIDELRTEGDGGVLNELLLGDASASTEFTAEKLKNKIDAYKQVLVKISPNVNLANLNTGTLKVYGEDVSWKKSNFEYLPIPLVIFNIIRIELGIKTTESALLNQL